MRRWWVWVAVILTAIVVQVIMASLYDEQHGLIYPRLLPFEEIHQEVRP